MAQASQKGRADGSLNTSDDHYDVIIVGGGVYGICTALESARHGLRTLLLERDEFGNATSANTFRIIHGGLRYLQSLDLHRFAESVRERTWFMREFPDLVSPLGFLMPLYGQGLRRRSVLRVALGFNNLLSRRRNEGLSDRNQLPNGRVLDRKTTIDLFADVRQEGLQGGACWYDAVMSDPRRIMSRLVRCAARAGATCTNFVEASRLLVGGDQVIGLQAVDRQLEKTITYRANVVVNCGGPWSRQLAKSLDRDVPQLFRPSLAFNVLLDRAPLSSHALAVSADGVSPGMRFLLPSDDRVLAGTWHGSWYHGIADPKPSTAQIDEFLGELNRAVPTLNVTRRDVLRVDAGLLPVVAEGTARMARRPIIHDHGTKGGPRGLYSVSGVKFTTARAVAERTVRTIISSCKIEQDSQTSRSSANQCGS